MAATAEPSPRRVQLLAAVVLLITFALGTATGAALLRHFEPQRGHRMPPPPMLVRELNLSAEQDAKVREIFERFRPRFDAVVRETFPRVRAINAEMDKEIRAVLTPEQQKRFDELKARAPQGGAPGGGGFGAPFGGPGRGPHGGFHGPRDGQGLPPPDGRGPPPDDRGAPPPGDAPGPSAPSRDAGSPG
jgi:Spy/CpxP family protein refolding chaperone